MRRIVVLAALAVVLASATTYAQDKTALRAYFIDVEGGQSTLFVSPSGQSLLVDTGWPGARDAGRIVSVAKAAGLSKIDFLLLTHYHGDHAGGVVDLAGMIPVGTFIDHGPIGEQTLGVPQTYAAYLKVRGEGKHIVAKPGDKLPIPGLDVEVVSAATQTISKPLRGAGQPNPTCSGFKSKDEVADPLLAGENKQSVGIVIALGKFRLADFGDLTWNKEHDLACPNNLVGAIDVYVVSHHGQDISSLPMLVDAMHPRVAVMDNGANKGAAVPTFETLKTSPGLEDLWQLHFATDAKEHNVPEKFIANQGTGGTLVTGVPNEGTVYTIDLTAHPDGSFSVKNTRNGFQKDYPAKR